MSSSLVHDRPRDTAQRWASIGVGLVVVGVVSWMTYEGMNPRPIKKDGSDAAAAASASSASTAGSGAAVVGDAGATPSVGEESDGGLFMPSLSFGDASILPSSGPRTLKIGVILVAYQGAEGAAPNARSKKDALAMAERLAQDARADFHHAVTGGDPGSSDDIGRIPRGVLDPRTETSVFLLQSGEVSDVLETPKGYWIVKRID